MVPSAYRPGTCNIGRAARRERGLVALVSFVGALGYAAFVLVTDSPTVLLLGLFVPLSLAIEWSLQAKRSFCVTLALRGRYDLRDAATDGGQGTVERPAAREQDRRYALQLTIAGVVAGAILTALFYAAAMVAGF